LYDAPPRITYPTGLDNPENLNLVANLSHVPNRFLCEAENADAVVWKYLSKIGDTPQDMIPKPFEQQQQEEKDNKVFRVLAEVGRNHDNVALLNGYYQCFAYNSKFNRGYVTMTPPIRLFVPGKAPMSEHKAINMLIYIICGARCIDFMVISYI